MAMTLDELVTQLKTAYGNYARSVVLYGSASAGEHIAKKSDYNVLVVLDAVPLDRLAAVGAVLRRGVKPAILPPMMFTADRVAVVSRRFPDGVRGYSRAARVLSWADPCIGITVEPG